MSKEIVTQEFLHASFDYKNGRLYNKKSGHGKSTGSIAGTIKSDSGYRVIKIKGRAIYEHRLIFMWHYGYFPKIIDHKNRNRSDNRIENLEDSNASKNAMNSGIWKTNTSGYRGVTKHTKNNSWIGQTWINGKKHHVGSFKTPYEAYDAVQKYRLANKQA